MVKVKILPSLRAPILDQTPEAKYLQTMAIISKNIHETPIEKCVCSFSGGKDSTLVLWLIRHALEQQNKDPSSIKVMFNNTGVEYGQTITFIRELTELWNLDIIENRPEKTFFQCVKAYGWPRPKSSRKTDPGKKNKSPECCKWLKEKPGNKALKEGKFTTCFMGITAMESHQRQMRAVTHGTCYTTIKDSIKKVHPILYWTEQEIWDFIKENNIPWNPVYKLVDRCGCGPCTAYKLWKKNLQAVDEKMYRFVMRKQGQELIS
ncbi:phosphoadenosine phosphosulfate reductase family protein [Methanoregula sp.]|uniref:phosphoadenosine phosphosulfate reductase family protein n=1 Tax=Methanoregula sp. TaxID=2052170 RepID=UPI0035674A31